MNFPGFRGKIKIGLSKKQSISSTRTVVEPVFESKFVVLIAG